MSNFPNLTDLIANATLDGATIATSAGINSPPSIDSLYLIYSLTKTYIAAATLILAEKKAIDLDAPFSAWLPEIPESSRFSIRQLLNHTAGLPDYGSLPQYHEAVKRGDPVWTFDDFLRLTLNNGLEYAPGQGWRYSNIGYMLLVSMIAKVTGQQPATALNELIFSPLGLSRTLWVDHKDQLQQLKPGYSRYLAQDDTLVDVRLNYDPGWAAHGVIASTASEVTTFYQGLFRGKLFSDATLRQMVASIDVLATHPRFVKPSYALGLMSDPDFPRGPVYGHTGEGPGYSAAAYTAITGEGGPITVTVLNNTEAASATEDLALKILTMLSASATQ